MNAAIKHIFVLIFSPTLLVCVCSVRPRSAWNSKINKIICKDYRCNKTMRINRRCSRKNEEIKEQFFGDHIIISATWKDCVARSVDELAHCGHVQKSMPGCAMCMNSSSGQKKKNNMEVAICVHETGSTIQINTQRQKQSYEQVKYNWYEWMRAAVVHITSYFKGLIWVHRPWKGKIAFPIVITDIRFAQRHLGCRFCIYDFVYWLPFYDCSMRSAGVFDVHSSCCVLRRDTCRLLAFEPEKKSGKKNSPWADARNV